MTAAKAVIDSGIFLTKICVILFLCKCHRLISNMIISTARSFSSSFWQKMEQYFGFLSDADIDYLKQQVMAFLIRG